MRSDCDRRWEIDALREGKLAEKDAEAFERHVRVCEGCAATIARDARLRELAVAMRGVEPKELDLRRNRARVLRDVANGEPAPRRAGFAVSAVSAVVVALLLFFWAERRPRPVVASPLAAAPPAEHEASSPERATMSFASTVSAEAGARWSRTRDGGVERVRLEEGALLIHVRHQTDSERFLVDLPDGELEVRGTTFAVSTSATATKHVRVDEGVIALRVRAAPAEIVLHAGESWAPVETKSPEKAASRATSSAGSARPSATSASPPEARDASSAPAQDDGADAYGAAILLWQGAHYASAAEAFLAFVRSHPSAPQVEDASFLEAAALSRAGRPDAAALAAEHHLARFPNSFHRREAAMLVARAARDRGECAQVRSVLAPWLSVRPDDDVRDAAGQCLSAKGTSE